MLRMTAMLRMTTMTRMTKKIKRENTTKNLEDLLNNMEPTLESLKEQERKSGYSSCSEDQIEQITNEVTKVALAYSRLSMRLLVRGHSEEQIQRQANRAQSSGESALSFCALYTLETSSKQLGIGFEAPWSGFEGTSLLLSSVPFPFFSVVLWTRVFVLDFKRTIHSL